MKYLSLLSMFFIVGCASERPQHLGVPRSSLTICPDTPNCVSSESKDEEHRVAPLNSSIQDIERIIQNMDRANIIVKNERYLYAEFTSAIMGFVDDAEFLFDPDLKVVQVRSASRVGKSDLGVNRKRIEFIRSALMQ